MNEDGLEQYGIINNSKPSNDAFAGPIEEVELAYTGGTGVLFAAPMVEADAHKGVYVTGCADLSSAYASGKIKTGMKILAINGTSLNGLHGKRVAELMNTPNKNRVILRVQFDPTGFMVWDGGKLLQQSKQMNTTGMNRAPASGQRQQRYRLCLVCL